MSIRSFRGVSLLVVALVSTSAMAGCVASPMDSEEEIGAADDALSLPSTTYGFSESLKFCKKVNYGFGTKKVCTPGIGFKGDVTLGEYEMFQGIPVGAAVVVDLDQPFNAKTTISVGLDSEGGKVCYDLSKYNGVEMAVCAKAVDRDLDTANRELTFKLKLSVKGSAKVAGVGISQEVTLYTTPAIAVPY